MIPISHGSQPVVPVNGRANGPNEKVIAMTLV
jgi:hypothetical protein